MSNRHFRINVLGMSSGEDIRLFHLFHQTYETDAVLDNSTNEEALRRRIFFGGSGVSESTVPVIGGTDIGLCDLAVLAALLDDE